MFTNIPSYTWASPVANVAALPSGGQDGEARVTLDTHSIYIWDATTNTWSQVSGGGGGVTTLNSLSGALTLVAGTGISVTPAGSNITIASTGGSASWGSITGSTAQEVPSGGFTTSATAMIVKDGAFSGLYIDQDGASGVASLQVMDTNKNLRLLPGSVSGIAFLGYLAGMGGVQAYTNLAYTILGGNIGASSDNSFSLGTDETGAFVNGNRWKDIFVGTSFRGPLYTDRNQSSGSAATDTTFRGANNTGVGAGGAMSLQGGTSGGTKPGNVNVDAAQGNAYQFATPATTNTVTIGTGVSVLVLDPAGTIALATITLPASPDDKQRIRVGTSNTITGLTVNPSGAETVKNAPTTLAAGGSFEYIYRLANTTWYKIG